MPDVPRPGGPARGSATGRPIMALLDLLGRRWTLRVIWELREGPLTFRELQARCGATSSSVLNERLAELRAAGIAETSASGYRLTDEGHQLLAIYPPVQAWAERWARREREAAET
jgi:DNA-binding HxlR family transcriptional regulator